MKTLIDLRGLEVSGANAEALEAYEQALREFQCYVGDPVASAKRAIEAAPGFTMAHCLNAYLHLAGSEATLVPIARDSVAAAARGAADSRERQHLAALRALLEGEYRSAGERLEALLTDHPRDILALQVAHLFDFFRGDSRNLRDRIARVRHAWSDADPGYHAVLGMHAFGLEECGDYGRAEATGRRALELGPRDAWAHHAVAHVMEMQGRAEDGVRWMLEREAFWAEDNFMAVHNWWHLALFQLELGRQEEVLALYDGRIRAGRSELMLDLVDASAMLWRLQLRGIDVGDRWQEVAQAWSKHVEEGYYAFNDFHALLAFVGAERWDLAEAQLHTLERAAQQQRGDNAAMAREVGLPLARGIYAFISGDVDIAIELLQRVRGIAQRFGGSNAQRDIVDLTLIEAARRAGRANQVRALAAERLALKPESPIARYYRRWAARATGERETALAA